MGEVNSQTSSRSPHWPALDGWRGFTIWFAISVHAGYFTGGGVLSLDTFFALSGFLITGLLLREWQRHEGIDLLAFWARRARRLLPALFVVLAAVVVYAAFVASPLGLDTLRGDVLSTLGYSANWRFVLSGQSYFSSFTTPSPVLHMWSLAVEEQFYLVWPLVVLGVLWVARRRLSATGAIVAVGVVAGVGAIASAITMVGALHAGRRRVARLLRHRHARAGDARRCSARGGGAAARPRAHPRRADRALDRRRAVARDRGGPVVRRRRARDPRRLLRALRTARILGRDRSGVVAAHPAVGRLVRSCPRVVTTALGRCHLVRDVPVALAHLPLPDPTAHGARRRLAAGGTARGRRRPVMGDQRARLGTDPPRCAAALPASGAFGGRHARRGRVGRDLRRDRGRRTGAHR